MNPKAAAKRILELDKETTPGPWRVFIVPNEVNIIDPNGVNLIEFSISNSACQWTAQSRNLSPIIAKRYLEAIGLLRAATWRIATKDSVIRSCGVKLGDENPIEDIEKFLAEHEGKE